MCPVSLVPLVPTWGVVRRFSGYSDRLPVGVGVFQYMPLNRILWLLAGIFGYVVRCPFSALPVASFSPLCPAARPFSVAVSWPLVRVFSCGELVKTARLRFFMPWGRCPLLVSWDWRCRACAVVMALAGRRAWLYRFARPLPIGAGEYVRPAGVVSVCGERVGVSLRFPLSCCSSSYHIAAPSSLLASLFSPRRHRSRRPSTRPPASVPVPCVLVWFLIASLPVLATSRAGRSLLALPHPFRLSFSRLVPRACLPSVDRSWPFLFAPPSSHAAACPAPVSFVSHCPLFVLPPRSSTSVDGERGGSFFACLLPSFSPAALLSCGRRAVSAGAGVLLDVEASSAGCVGFVVSLFVYMNWGVIMYDCCCRKKAIEKGFSTMMTNEMALDTVSVAAGLVASPLMGIGLATGAVPVLTFGLYLAAMGWNTYRAVKCYESR